VKVMARRGRTHFKASPWELEDAEEELVEIVENHAPRRFVIEDGRLLGMEFDRVEWYGENGRQRSRTLETVFFPCDDVILAIGQENAFPWIERDIGIEFGEWDMPVVDRTTFQSTLPGVFFGGDAAWGPENIIWAVEHGHQAAISIHNHCRGVPLSDRPPWGMNLVSMKMGFHEWSYSNAYDAVQRQKMVHADLNARFRDIGIEVELGFTPEQTQAEVERCLNCDVQTHFTAPLCIECDACIDICPTDCLTIAELPVASEKTGSQAGAGAQAGDGGGEAREVREKTGAQAGAGAQAGDGGDGEGEAREVRERTGSQAGAGAQAGDGGDGEGEAREVWELLARRLTATRAHPEQPLYVSERLPQTGRVMVKDEDLCLHCGLCAERCPTAAWDMRQFELLVTYAGGQPGSLPVLANHLSAGRGSTPEPARELAVDAR
jgi:ferredoxin